MVWKQILKDLRKEWAWAFFYTVVATMIAMAILYLSVSFSSVQRQAAAIRSFVRRNVVMFQMKTVQMEPNPEGAASANRQQKNPDAVLDYLQHSLSADGKAGSFVFVGNDGYVDKKYTQILILFGQYSTLAGLHYDGDMALFVPEAHREDAGGSVTISDREIETVANAGVQFDLFHPLHYIEPDNPLLSDTLILCTRDFQTVNKMFPWWSPWQIHPDSSCQAGRSPHRGFYADNHLCFDPRTQTVYSVLSFVWRSAGHSSDLQYHSHH